MAKSDIIATLDADDTFDKRKLEMMVPMAKKHGMAVSNIRIIEDETNVEFPSIQYTPHTRLIEFNELLAINACGNFNVVFKKPGKLIYYTDKVHYCEDLFFASQIYDYYGKAFYFRHKLYNYCLNNDSLCRSKKATDYFFRDRIMLISLLKKNEIDIKNNTTKDMLISYIQAGHDINEKHSEMLPLDVFIDKLRKLCPFLPNRRSWK